MPPEAQRLSGAPPFTRRILLALCAALAACAPLCLFFGVRGFAPVVGIAGLLCLPLARPSRRDWVGVLLLAALVLWAAVSTLWSPAESMAHSVKSISRLTILHLAAQLAFSAAFITALARLDSAGARKALTWIAFGFLAVLLLLTEEGVSHGALYLRLLALVHDSPGPGRVVRALAQGGYALAVAVWPLAMALHRQRRTWLALAMVAFVPLSMVLLRGFAPTAALAVSLPVFFLTRRYGRPAILVLAGLTVAYFLVTPLVMLAIDHGGLYASLKPHLPPSWAERLRIWSFVAERLAEHPLRGAGLDASRMFPGIVPLHPHNGALQLWFELGAPGALLGSAFWVWLWRRIGDCADRDRLYGAVAASTATVYLVIGAVGFGLWQEWWMCVGSFAMMLCILFGKTASRDEPAAGAARRK